MDELGEWGGGWVDRVFSFDCSSGKYRNKLSRSQKKSTVHTSANRILQIGTLRSEIKLITGRITIIRLHFSEKLNIVLIKDNRRAAIPGVSALETGV